MTTRGHKGRFRPKNPSKYKGDPSNIIYRSLWEFKFFRYVDMHPDIIWWQSEEVIVPYYSRKHRRDHLTQGKKIKPKQVQFQGVI